MHKAIISWFTDFLAAKTGRSVGKFFQKALLCQVVEKSYRYMEIVIKSDVLVVGGVSVVAIIGVKKLLNTLNIIKSSHTKLLQYI